MKKNLSHHEHEQQNARGSGIPTVADQIAEHELLIAEAEAAGQGRTALALRWGLSKLRAICDDGSVDAIWKGSEIPAGLREFMATGQLQGVESLAETDFTLTCGKCGEPIPLHVTCAGGGGSSPSLDGDRLDRLWSSLPTIAGRNGPRSITRDQLAEAMFPRPTPIPSDAVERVAEAVYDFLDERFPEGALPGGVQLFADDHLDAEMKHEAGCEELARAIIAAIKAAEQPQ